MTICTSPDSLQDHHGGGQRAAGGPGQPPPGEADREHRLHDHQPRAPADGLGGGCGRWRPPASPDLATDQPRVAAAALVTSNLVGGTAGLAALLPASVSSRTSGQDPASPPHNALTGGNAWMWKYSALQTCQRCLMKHRQLTAFSDCQLYNSRREAGYWVQ